MIKKKAKVIAIVNQKGGVGKTLTTISLGVGLAKAGKSVLIVDCDPQGSATISLGHHRPGDIEVTLASIMKDAINDAPFNMRLAVLQHSEGVDFIPANRNLSGVEMTLVSAIARESILRQCLEGVVQHYDYVILDCLPSLGMLTVNALAAADSMLIPAQPQFLSMKGLEELLLTYTKIRKQINPALRIDGILLMMVNHRTNYARDIIQALRDAYGSRLRIFDAFIPQSIRAAETSALGVSIFAHDPTGKVAMAYEALAQEVLSLG